MVNKTVWERAILLSLLVHLILVPTIGWAMSRKMFQLPPRQEVIELEMVSLPPEPQPLVQPPVQEQKIVKEVVPKQPTPKPVVTPEKPIEKPVAKPTPIAREKGAVTDRVASPGPNTNAQPSREGGSSGNTTGPAGDAPAGNEGLPSPPRQIVYLPPQLLKKMEPPYPSSAREKGLEGTAVIRVEILENGQVGEVAVRKSSGHQELDEAAIKAVKKWRFVPAKDKDTGDPVKCFTNFPVIFRLT